MASFVYIMTNRKDGVLYIGVTSDLIRRTFEHKFDIIQGFTKRYQCKQLVYYEQAATLPIAIAREKQLKNWQRNWKIDLINAFNPE